MQVPILNGVYSDGDADFRTSYPINLVPVPKQNGIANGYLRPADGIVEFGTGPGIDRGGINWNGKYYRVMGSKLVYIDELGAHTEIGDVGDDGKQVKFDYSFDYLAIASNLNLFLYDGSTFNQVTDPDLGNVVDMIWIDGYFMTTDGEFLVVTDLGDPFAVNPTKYGSSEINPDEVIGLAKLRNEVYAVNRYTTEVFDNVGATGFPFARIEGAHIERGAVGTHAICIFNDTLCIVGGRLNEPTSIWACSNGASVKIATREIDQILSTFTESQLSLVSIETRVYDSHNMLYVHLPDRTLVYDSNASAAVGAQVWFTLSSSYIGVSEYRAKNLVYVYDKWLCGDPTSSKHGELVNNISSHYGDLVAWEFGTTIVYNAGSGAIFHEIELVSLTGRTEIDASISTQRSVDGMTWSQPKYVSVGKKGNRTKRIVWFRQGNMKHWRIQRFRGNSDAFISPIRLEIRLEPLNE